MLLGGSWSSELDGGDPMRDRSCLLNTARRCVLAQSMVDINMYCRYMKMCEIIYQRPREEIKGKLYPEQDEVTVVYLCMVQPQVDITSEEFEALWEHYCARVEGKEVGPIVNMDAETSSNLLFTAVAQPTTNTESTTEASVDNDTTAVTDASSNTQSHSNGEDIVEDKADETVTVADVVEDTGAIKKEDHDEVTEPNTIEPKATDETVTSSGEPVMNVDTNISEEGNDNKTTPLSPSASTAATATAVVGHSAVSTTTHLIKPEKSSVLICPMPLSKELGSDSIRRLEGVSVKLLTLSQILSYSEDDSNERIFEASIAAELLRSLIAVDYADVITDFIMSEYANMTYCGDPRVYSAVKTLRKMAKTSTAISKVPASTTDHSDNAESTKSDTMVVTHSETTEVVTDTPAVVNDTPAATTTTTTVIEEGHNDVASSETTNNHTDVDVDTAATSHENQPSEKSIESNEAREEVAESKETVTGEDGDHEVCFININYQIMITSYYYNSIQYFIVMS